MKIICQTITDLLILVKKKKRKKDHMGRIQQAKSAGPGTEPWGTPRLGEAERLCRISRNL